MAAQHIDRSSAFHFGACFATALLSTEFSAGLGIGKEIGDYFHYRHFCHWDILFDVIGIVTGTLVRLIAIRLIYGYWQYNWI